MSDHMEVSGSTMSILRAMAVVAQKTNDDFGRLALDCDNYNGHGGCLINEMEAAHFQETDSDDNVLAGAGTRILVRTDGAKYYNNSNTSGHRYCLASFRSLSLSMVSFPTLNNSVTMSQFGSCCLDVGRIVWRSL